MSQIDASSLEKLIELSTLLISNLELEPLLTKILQTTNELMNAEAANIMLLDETTGELYYEVALGSAGEKIKQQNRIKVGTGIAGWVAENRLPLLSNDAYSDPRFFADFDKKTGFKTHNILCLPLLVREKLIGVAQIINKRGAADFVSLDQELFSRYCAIAAIAIDNALMHKKILEQDRLQRDLKLAEEIQKTFLPKKIPQVEHLRLEFRSLACRHVGGDIIDIQQIPDGRISILLGDVSGKGVPAALFGAKFATDYEHILSHLSLGQDDMGGVMKRLNNFVFQRSTRGMFVTAIHACVDTKNGNVQLINAGHVQPVLIGPKSGQIQIVNAEGSPPLGVKSDLSFTASSLQLQSGQTLLLMTDGATEAKSKTGQRLGIEQIQKAVQQRASLALPRLMTLITQFTQGEPLADDVTVVAVSLGNHSTIEIESNPAQLAKVREFLKENLSFIKINDQAQQQIALAVTEALANVIKHTYKMSLTGRIQISVQPTLNAIDIHIRDWGPRQDPTKFKSRDLDEVRPGGIGVHYMQELMDIVEYDNSLPDGNELHMCKIFSDKDRMKMEGT